MLFRSQAIEELPMFPHCGKRNNIPRQYQDVARWLQGVFFKECLVFRKFNMKVGGVLNVHRVRVLRLTIITIMSQTAMKMSRICFRRELQVKVFSYVSNRGVRENCIHHCICVAIKLPPFALLAGVLSQITHLYKSHRLSLSKSCYLELVQYKIRLDFQRLYYNR